MKYYFFFLLFATPFFAITQNGSVTFEYNQANGNRMEGVIDLAKGLKTKININ